MGRRRNGGALDDLFEIAAMLPWWVGVLLAVIGYLGLHLLAGSELLASKPGQMGGYLSHAVFKGLALGLQYVVPVALLAGAAASAIGRYKRKGLVAAVAGGESAAVLGGMSWQEFEALVSEAFRLEGFQVAETGGGGPDGGVDLVLRKGKEKYLVQCKRRRAFKVGVTIVRELYGVMAAQGAAGGYVVTSGKFTSDAVEFASGTNVTLVDGQKLFAMFEAVRKKKAGTSQQAKPAQQSVARERAVAQAAPARSNCGKAMVPRVAKQGATAGKPFWGCPGFPACRGVRPIA
ncbi:MAG TPA: restriction endonuclease [Burkholderiales bacterium]|nr:restriction endonuclease [Burkholderiales bacterium]